MVPPRDGGGLSLQAEDHTLNTVRGRSVGRRTHRMRWSPTRVVAPRSELGQQDGRSGTYADYPSIGAQRPRARTVEDEEPGAAGLAAEARRLRARLHPDAQEAELGAAQGGA